jgi:hypothetical protein
LPDDSGLPLQLFILPKKATQEAQVVTIRNPQNSRPTRYLICPQAGIYEFSKISPPKSMPRSFFLDCNREHAEVTREGIADSTKAFQAHISTDADLYVASLVDPLFLILPALRTGGSSSKASNPSKRLFLSSDDYFDVLSETSEHVSTVLRWASVRQLIESRMSAICDTVEAGDETMYRLNEDKVFKELLSKAEKMSKTKLPKSMENHFVAKPLEAPILASRREVQPGSSANLTAGSPSADNGISQQTDASGLDTPLSSVTPSESFTSEASTAATSVADATITEEVAVAIKPSEEVLKQQRLKVAFTFICSRYVESSYAEGLRKQFEAEGSSVDLGALRDYEGRLSKIKQEVMAARSMTDYSRKRTMDEEEDERAEKRRKKEEEEKRKKAGESRGVRDLKKVNVSGMKKLSEFFKKK